MAENVSDAETYESDEGSEGSNVAAPYNPMVGDSVVIVKEGIKEGKLVKSTVYGETATVTDADWNGVCKVKIMSGKQKGVAKSYKRDFLKREGEEAEAYLKSKREEEQAEGEVEAEEALPPPPPLSPSQVETPKNERTSRN